MNEHSNVIGLNVYEVSQDRCTQGIGPQDLILELLNQEFIGIELNHTKPGYTVSIQLAGYETIV